MFRISHVIGAHREHDRRRLAAIQDLLAVDFPDLGADDDYVARKLIDQAARGTTCILLVAHGPGDRVIGFALADYFETIGYAYLDFIITEPRQGGLGPGGALYEALIEDLTARGARGLFLEVPTDDPAQVTDPAELKANRSRLQFYERYGTRPIVGTLYDQPIRPGQPSEPRLLYDPLQNKDDLEADDLRKVIKAILTLRYHFKEQDPYVIEVLASVKDSPV